MEYILFTCIEAQKLIGNVTKTESITDNNIKIEIIEELINVSPKECKFDLFYK